MKSDIYSLGVLFFELFNPCGEHERPRILAGLRHRILPLAVLQGRPQVRHRSCMRDLHGSGHTCNETLPSPPML